MSGFVSITIRDQEQEHRLFRSIAPIPFLVADPAFLDGDPAPLQDYLLRHPRPLRGEFPSESGPGLLAPMDYGLVVIDLRTKKILSHQLYTHFGRIMNMVWYHHDLTDLFHRIWASGRIKWEKTQTRNFVNSFGDSQYLFQEPNLTWEEFESRLKVRDKDLAIHCIEMDLSPFSVLDYVSEGLGRMREEILNLGFELSTEEDEQWEDFQSNGE